MGTQRLKYRFKTACLLFVFMAQIPISAPGEDLTVPIDARGRRLDSAVPIKRRAEYFLDRLSAIPSRMKFFKSQRRELGWREGPRIYEAGVRYIYREAIAAKWHFFDQCEKDPSSLLSSEQELAGKVQADLRGKVRPARDLKKRSSSELLAELEMERKKFLGSS